MASKWAQRFYESLVDSKQMGFDDISSGRQNTRITGAKARNLDERMVELKDRISRHAGITVTLPLPLSCLAWNKNPQCPPKTWDNLQASTDGKYDRKSTGYKCCIWRSEYNKGQECFNNPIDCGWDSKCSSKPQGWKYSSHKKCLVIAHHNSYSDTLKTADYAEAYFNSVFNNQTTVCRSIINADSGERHGFWLINEDDSPFVYAILKSSMFRAWCELTAADEGEEEGHFSPGMWDTFPIQDTTTLLSKLSNRYVANIFQCEGGDATVERAISCAGRWLSRNMWEKHSPIFSFDECMDELYGFGPVPSSPYSRKQILAKGFLNIFLSLKTDVMSLA